MKKLRLMPSDQPGVARPFGDRFACFQVVLRRGGDDLTTSQRAQFVQRLAEKSELSGGEVAAIAGEQLHDRQRHRLAILAVPGAGTAGEFLNYRREDERPKNERHHDGVVVRYRNRGRATSDMGQLVRLCSCQGASASPQQAVGPVGWIIRLLRAKALNRCRDSRCAGCPLAGWVAS